MISLKDRFTHTDAAALYARGLSPKSDEVALTVRRLVEIIDGLEARIEQLEQVAPAKRGLLQRLTG